MKPWNATSLPLNVTPLVEHAHTTVAAFSPKPGPPGPGRRGPFGLQPPRDPSGTWVRQGRLGHEGSPWFRSRGQLMNRLAPLLQLQLKLTLLLFLFTPLSFFTPLSVPRLDATEVRFVPGNRLLLCSRLLLHSHGVSFLCGNYSANRLVTASKRPGNVADVPNPRITICPPPRIRRIPCRPDLFQPGGTFSSREGFKISNSGEGNSDGEASSA